MKWSAYSLIERSADARSISFAGKVSPLLMTHGNQWNISFALERFATWFNATTGPNSVSDVRCEFAGAYQSKESEVF
ncbi:hypothetical protein GUITHDRAFT_120136 [Guillardia theta CCMP2712]|uniref:Uncharacterized protein n=1 Tax=Guillardia theta (strain CCMP2712) TaxID=905079 RepID=L1ICX1_GUITC|nr:hypothetical protein GUITHDRAFT_120136 [Guillardia theta CCMP2712]EKX33685.1 hypothetical protein GUITHDRAFT_120136 [Guillardia theta CCMP2712]|eukprot:XP_005820665.1 hypothetical protein GUITHDRAFT_120136 [Guillardia theta CCMP2712]